MKTKSSDWSTEEIKLIKSLDTPFRIQEFLNECAYNSSEETRSPRYVMQLKRAHCMEGGLFAAACLEYHGHRPLLLDLRAVNDDDHILALYRRNNCWGAIGKSNFTTLKLREAIYRTTRELALSYFDLYFNSEGEKSLREYSSTFDLNRYNSIYWRTTAEDLEQIGQGLDRVRHYPILKPEQVSQLSPADPLLLKSSMMGADPAGLFVPGSKKG